MIATILALTLQALPPTRDENGVYLYNTCRSAQRMLTADKPDAKDFPGGNYCIGYIEGFIDGSGTIKRGACVPESASANDIIAVYVAYMGRHKEDLTAEKGIGLLFALAAAYPCSAK